MSAQDNQACSLANKECVPCKGGVPPLKGEPLREMLNELDGWEAVDEHHLKKTWAFKNFKIAQAFVNCIGELAERQHHHPWIHFTWGQVIVEVWTHKIDGLTESDFILAAKIDTLHTS